MSIRVTRYGPAPLAEIRAALAEGAELRVAWRRRIGFLTDGRAVRLVTGAEASALVQAGLVRRDGKTGGWDRYRSCCEQQIETGIAPALAAAADGGAGRCLPATASYTAGCD